jgi:MoaA/NifB/PqqE/SkfB family radical SAM enzyme
MDLNFKDPVALKSYLDGRDVYLWGAAIVGLGMCRALERAGIQPAGFIDSSPRFQGKTVLGYPVSLPEAILSRHQGAKKPFILITSGHYDEEIAGLCADAGWIKEADFLSSKALNTIDPSIDISGICNLHCISCPRGNLPYAPPKGFMDVETYGKVLDKLIAEIPFMGLVQLYAWGEPLLNPHLPEIIRVSGSKNVLCELSTNLNVHKKNLFETIQARPGRIRVSVSGFGRDYQTTHTGGNWDLLLENLYRLRDYRNQLYPEMYVEVNYHLYRHNTGEPYRQMKALCRELDFLFRPCHAYLYPLDNALRFCEGQPLSPEAKKTLGMLLLPIEEGLKRAAMQRHLECGEERCLPINWNLNVRACGAYYEPVLVDNFLTTPLEEIIRARRTSALCKQCRSHSLHRYNPVYLQEKIIEEDNR